MTDELPQILGRLTELVEINKQILQKLPIVVVTREGRQVTIQTQKIHLVIPKQILELIELYYPPKNATTIDISPEPVNISPGETKTIISYKVNRNNAVIRWFGQSTSLADAYDYLRWYIKVNNRYIEPYNPIIGEYSDLIKMMELLPPLRLKKGDTVEIEVKNPSNAPDTYAVTARIRGWKW